MIRLSKLGRIIPQVQSQFDVKNSTISLGKFLCIIFIGGHWCGCCFYLFAKSLDFPEESWTQSYLADNPDDRGPLRQRDVNTKYLASLYWAITIMSTSGFGDITP